MITMVELMGYGGGGASQDEQATRKQMAEVGDDGRREVAGGQTPPPSSKYGRAVLSNMLNRTGHARFRRGPTVPEPATPGAAAAAAAPDSTARRDGFSASASASSSFPSSVTGVTGEGSVSNGRALLAASGAGGERPPPLQVASDCTQRLKRRNRDDGHNAVHDVTHGGGGGGRCHCTKKRKPRVKRSIIRVPAISSKNADIPPDDYSWRKYGQKPIKGSPYQRGYYRCSTVRGCPARKHVERDPGEPAMLIVTYEGDHRHDAPDAAAPERRTP